MGIWRTKTADLKKMLKSEAILRDSGRDGWYFIVDEQQLWVFECFWFCFLMVDDDEICVNFPVCGWCLHKSSHRCKSEGEEARDGDITGKY